MLLKTTDRLWLVGTLSEDLSITKGQIEGWCPRSKLIPGT